MRAGGHGPEQLSELQVTIRCQRFGAAPWELGQVRLIVSCEDRSSRIILWRNRGTRLMFRWLSSQVRKRGKRMVASVVRQPHQFDSRGGTERPGVILRVRSQVVSDLSHASETVVWSL